MSNPIAVVLLATGVTGKVGGSLSKDTTSSPFLAAVETLSASSITPSADPPGARKSKRMSPVPVPDVTEISYTVVLIGETPDTVGKTLNEPVVVISKSPTSTSVTASEKVTVNTTGLPLSAAAWPASLLMVDATGGVLSVVKAVPVMATPPVLFLVQLLAVLICPTKPRKVC